MDPEETPASPSNGAQEKTESTERAIKKSRRTKEEWKPGLMESLGFRSSDVGAAVKEVAETALTVAAVTGTVWCCTQIVVRGVKEAQGVSDTDDDDENTISI